MAFDPLTKTDIALEAVYLALHVVDWGQTLYISDNPEYHDHCPALGKHPSRAKVNLWFASTAILHPVVTYMLPKEYRPYWQGGTIAMEVACTLNNRKCGIRVSF